MSDKESPEVDFYDKPGSALASVIPAWAVDVSKGCGCRDMAKKMDKWGVKGCYAKYDEIIKHLLSKGNDALIPSIARAPKMLKTIAAKYLLNRALQLASKRRG